VFGQLTKTTSTTVYNYFRRKTRVSSIRNIHLNPCLNHCLSRYSRHYTSVSVWSAAPCFRHHIVTPSPVVNLLWTGHPSVAACNRRWSFICCCWPQALEHSAWGHYICAVFTGVPTKTEDSFVSAILSEHYTVACVACCARWSLKFLLRPP